MAAQVALRRQQQQETEHKKSFDLTFLTAKNPSPSSDDTHPDTTEKSSVREESETSSSPGLGEGKRRLD